MNSLATRCPECGTSFRVQAAQLAASQGFVRCGRCDAVFDARQSLFDLDTGMPAASGLPSEPCPVSDAAQPSDAMLPTHPQDAPQGAEAGEHPVSAEPLRGDARVDAEPQWVDETHTPTGGRPEPDWSEQPWAPPEPSGSTAHLALDPDEANARMKAMLGLAPEGAQATNPSAWASLSAETSTRVAPQGWQSVGWVLCAVMALTLPIQWAWTERAPLLARFPVLLHVWERICPSCAAPAWPHLEGLSVTSSSLQPTPQGEAYRLQLTLSNRNSHPLATPSVDLRLQDEQGRVVVRRVLTPTDLSAATDRVAAGAQVAMHATFRVLPDAHGKKAIAGYEVALFHP